MAPPDTSSRRRSASPSPSPSSEESPSLSVTDYFHVNGAFVAFLAVAFLSACSGQSCDCQGFKQQSFPKKHYNKTVPKTGQVRVSDYGLQYLEGQVPNIIKQFMPGGLNFCVPKSSGSGATVCGGQSCKNGTEGCQLKLSIEDAQINPSPPDTLEINLTIGKLNEVIPVSAIGQDCNVDLHKPNADKDVAAQLPVTVPIKFVVNKQSPTNDVSIEVGELDPKVDKIDFDISGQGKPWENLGCEAGGLVTELDFVRNLLNDLIKDQLKEPIQSAVSEQLCRKCGNMAPACPSKSACKKIGSSDTKVCKWTQGDRKDKCVGRKLGVEGRLIYQAILGDFMERDEAEVDVMAKAADLAKVDSGLSIGLRTGFQQTALSDCAPVDPMKRPKFDPIPESTAILSNKKPGSNESFMLGLGLHKRALEHMFWSTWASGALCFKIGSEFHQLLNTDGISLLVQGIKQLADDKGPIFLRITPQTMPTVELGDNTIKEDGMSYTLEDPLMTVNWKDLDLHFYAYVQERHTRLFTVRTDLKVPVGLRGDGMGSIIPVVGDLKKAAKNIRVRNNRILSDDPKKIKQLIPTLLGAALPQVAGSLSKPIELPEFFGYRLAIEQDDITSVDNNQFIALYADLVYVGNSMPLMATNAPVIAGTRVDAHATTSEGVPRPRVELDVATGLFKDNKNRGSSKPREFSYRLDGGVWSRYTRANTLELDDPVLALQGKHTVEVRARVAGTPGTASEPVSTSVLVDYDAPSLAIRRDGGRVVLDGSDTVDEPGQMDYRWRLTSAKSAGASSGWSRWSTRRTLTPRQLPGSGQVTLEAQARDRSGHVTTTRRTLDLEAVRAVAVSERKDSTSNPNAQPGAVGGCSTTGGRRPGPFGWLAVLFVAGLLGRRRRGDDAGDADASQSPRRLWSVLGLTILLAGAVGLGGCSDYTAQKNKCKPSCADWETCEAGNCIPQGCTKNEECPDGSTCRDGQCKEADCQKDADCECAQDRRGVCMNGQCLCKQFCPDGCSDGKYCCYAENKCKSIPDACKGKSCEPGYEPKVTDKGTPDNKSCKVTGGTCECVEKPPLDLRWYGQYADMATNADGGVAAVSAYNRYFGDLMVGVLDGALKPTWYFPDGAPDSGKIEAAPSGPRGGIVSKGDDVGTHTAIAAGADGTLHVLYRSEENGALKYARGTKGGDGYSFETTKLDEAGTTGLYTSVTLHGGRVWASYGVESIDVEVPGNGMGGNGMGGNGMGDAGMGGNGMGDAGMGNGSGMTKKIERTQLRHINFPVDTPLDQIDPATEIVHQSPPANPCDSRCTGDGEVCFEAAAKCAKPTDDCSSACGEGQACKSGSCVAAYDPPTTPSRPAMTGLYSETLAASDGRIVVVFYDHIRKRIGWAWRDPAGTWSDADFLEHASGPYASGALDANDKLHLAYMDPRTRSLRYRQVDAKADAEFIVDGLRSGGGEYLDAAIGHDVELSFDANDKLRVTFQDATKHRLHAAMRMGKGNWTDKVLARPGPDGMYSGAHGFFAAAHGDVVAEMVIDVQDEESPGAHMEFHKIGK